VSGCDGEASITRRAWHVRGCWAMGEKKKLWKEVGPFDLIFFQ